MRREALEGSVLRVAPALLGKILASRSPAGELTAGRIVEVEAYREDDPASHSHRGVTPRTRTMFGPAGHLYVYFTYGMHWCCNVVVGPPGVGAAVLLRAVEPVLGEEIMWSRRAAARTSRDLASGPARTTQALGLDGSHDGVDLLDEGAAVALLDDGNPPRGRRRRGPRIGIRQATEKPWRWWLDGNPHVSRR
ncbi:MAG: DNA-3-methyladenine glycosylase [Acidobacteria bacterium]|nr:MAG: DNA-3-methyladenine glycosylase [Acidobacteriota bacterium]